MPFPVEVIANWTGTKLALPEREAIWTDKLVTGGKDKHMFSVLTVDLAYFPIVTAAARKASEVVRTLGGLLLDAVWYFDLHCSPISVALGLRSSQKDL